MQHLIVAASTTPSPTPTLDPDLVTPGPIGFAVMAVLVIAVVLLIADMLRRIRRARYRSEVAEELDAEEAAARNVDGGADDPDDASGDVPEGPRPTS